MIDFNIEDIFKDIPANEIPNNRPVKPNPPEHVIVAGGSCNNEFMIPFAYLEDISYIEVLYHQFKNLTLVKILYDIEIKDTGFIVKVQLTPEESRLFEDTLLDTVAQVKVTIGNEILYSNLVKMTVVQTISINEN